MDDKPCAVGEYFEDWNDDERMGALYGEFRPKNVNPEGWGRKINVWSNAVNSWCRKNRVLKLTLTDLRTAFERKGQYPQCFDQVLQHMVNEGIFNNRSSVNANVPPVETQTWLNWGINVLVKRPVVWGWSAIQKSLLENSADCATQEFVHMGLLKEMCESIMTQLTSEVNPETSTVSVADCYTLCKKQCPQADSLLFILNHLQNQQKLVMFVESGTDYIKLCKKLDKQTKVTDTDVGLLRLQKTLEKVDSEVEKLRTDMESCTNQAKVAMRAGQKAKVQIILRRRKLMEKAVEQKLNTAEKLEAMIFKLQNTSSDQEVVGALKAGLSAQKEMAAKGLGIDDVEDTLEKIQEAFEDQAEIENILAGPMAGFSFSPDGDSALEEELDELLEQDKLNEKKPVEYSPSKTVDLAFPEVPATDPSPIRAASQFSVEKEFELPT